MNKHAEAVQRGIKLLDERWQDSYVHTSAGVDTSSVAEGADWRELIDLDELEMDRATACILGQLFGDYFIGRDVLRPDETRPWSVEHGFSVMEDLRSEWDALADAWHDALGEA